MTRKAPRRPAHPSQKAGRILIQEIQRSANIRQTTLAITAPTSLAQQGLALRILKPFEQGLESDTDAVGGAGGRGTRVVRVEVLVHVEDEVVGAAVKVSDACENGGGAAGYEGRGTSVAVAW